MWLTSPDSYRKVPNLAVDAAVLRRNPVDNEALQILLIRRSMREVSNEAFDSLSVAENDPFKACLAFPGGFVDYDEVLLSSSFVCMLGVSFHQRRAF